MADADATAATQKTFPNLTILADARKDLANSLGLLDSRPGSDGKEAFAPTTIVLDAQGVIRHVHRPATIADRLHWNDLLNRARSSLAAR